jgi:hypothetical protein
MVWRMTTMTHTQAGVGNGWMPAFHRSGKTAPATKSPRWKRLGITWHAALDYLVPMGHEDETGFHYDKTTKSNPPATTSAAR